MTCRVGPSREELASKRQKRRERVDCTRISQILVTVTAPLSETFITPTRLFSRGAVAFAPFVPELRELPVHLLRGT